MCNRNCNQGRLCPARLYPGIGKCSDLDNLDSKPCRGEQRREERRRISSAEIAIWIAWALWVVFMLIAALSMAAHEGLFDLSQR